MKPAMPMVHLTSTVGSFHAKVLAARLGSEGVLVNLRGAVDGPYPIFASVDVYVRQDQAAIAREILLADAVDAAFGEFAVDPGDPGDGGGGADPGGSGDAPWDCDAALPGPATLGGGLAGGRPYGRVRGGRHKARVVLTVAFLVVFVVVGYLAAAHSF
jgi:hypothetical protein